MALGALVAAATGTYALVVLLSGRVSDRVPRLLLARTACVGAIVACIGLTLADTLPRLLGCMPILGASMAFYWPSVQASIADRSTLGSLPRQLGRFNLSWSLGKSCGFLCGGILLAAFGAAGTFTVASAIVFLLFFVLPLPGSGLGPIDALLARQEGPRRTPPPEPPAEPIDARAGTFRRVAWIANCTAFGLGATLTYHYPSLVAARGASPRVFGAFLGTIYLTQTLAFAVLMRHPEAWRFRRLRLYVPQLVMIAAALGLPAAPGSSSPP